MRHAKCVRYVVADTISRMRKAFRDIAVDRGRRVRLETVVIKTSRHSGRQGGHPPQQDDRGGRRAYCARCRSGGKATYDLTGLTVMPGWIDTHVHLGWHFNREGRLEQGKATPEQSALYAEGNAYATLMGGFTTVQSVGSAIDGDLRDLIHAGVIPGPRILTSLRAVTENTGDPKDRAYVRKMKEDGADVIKLFATASIRDGGKQTMADEQVLATCSEAKALGLRSVVHAHAPGGAQAAVKAGCTSVEHGAFLDDATLQMMAEHGTYFDPNFLVLHNYLDEKAEVPGHRQLHRGRFRVYGEGAADDVGCLASAPWRTT